MGTSLVTLQDPATGATQQFLGTTHCVSAGPKYRDRDRDGVIEAGSVDEADLVTLDDTVLHALVYVRGRETHGEDTSVYRLLKVTAGRPIRADGAP
jgi:hypothetical protein